MARPGGAWRGKARNKAGQGKAGLGAARIEARLGKAWQGTRPG